MNSPKKALGTWNLDNSAREATKPKVHHSTKTVTSHIWVYLSFVLERLWPTPPLRKSNCRNSFQGCNVTKVECVPKNVDVQIRCFRLCYEFPFSYGSYLTGPHQLQRREAANHRAQSCTSPSLDHRLSILFRKMSPEEQLCFLLRKHPF